MAEQDALNILVLNAGSSSQKIALFTLEPGGEDIALPLWEATFEWTDDRGRGELTIRSSRKATPYRETLTAGRGRPQSVAHALAMLVEGEWACLSRWDEIAAVGHRVVHGGREYQSTTRITDAVREGIARLVELAPAHNPASLEGIAAVTELLGKDVPQFAAFDTAFHRTLPDAAALYPGPYAWWENGIRRYGFHGISHEYCAGRAAGMLGRDPKGLRIITCHLGNGCSLAAIRDGRSVDTTMGFTPADGLMMGTRSGSVDPGILLHLLREGADTDRLSEILSRESGLKGVSGISGDMREISAAIAGGNERAQLAFDTFIHRLRWHIGALLPALGGLDALVFTAGIGEHSAAVRAAACEGWGFLGIALDPSKNNVVSDDDRDIATPDAAVRVLVIRTQEDAAIARECAALLRD